MNDQLRTANSGTNALTLAYQGLSGTVDQDQSMINLKNQIADVQTAAQNAWDAQVEADKATSKHAKDAADKQAAAAQATRDYQTQINNLKTDIINLGQTAGENPVQVQADIDKINQNDLAGVEADAEAYFRAHPIDAATRLKLISTVVAGVGQPVSTSQPAAAAAPMTVVNNNYGPAPSLPSLAAAAAPAAVGADQRQVTGGRPAPPYNPAGYDPADPATWPPPIPPATLYQPGMAWTMTAAGTVDGQVVAVGDLLFVVHRPRLYGDGTYGAGMYGSTPDGNWTPADVRFVAWYSSYPGPDQPPYPYSGCKFGDTGWWVIIDAYFNDATDSRHYGDGTYGSGVYGGGSTAAARWVDITAGFTTATISRGTNSGAAKVDVTELDFTWYDPDWVRWQVTPPGSWSRPFVGCPIRVSFYDPQWGWHPRAVGTIEQIVDPTITRTSDVPRLVTVQAFGNLMDLTPTLLAWQRPAEKASTRFAALLAAAGWRFGTVGLVYPGDADLHADAAAHDVVAGRRDGPHRDVGRLDVRHRPPCGRLCAYGSGRCRHRSNPAARLSRRLRRHRPGRAGRQPDRVHRRRIAGVEHRVGVERVEPTERRAVDRPDVDRPVRAARQQSRVPGDRPGVRRRRRRSGDRRPGPRPLQPDRHPRRTARRRHPSSTSRWLGRARRPSRHPANTSPSPAPTPAPFTLESIVVGIVEQITPGRIEATLSTTTTTPTT